MRDADFGVVRLRAYGTYDFRIVDVTRFLKEVAGTDDHFRLDEFNDAMRSRIVSVFSDALARARRSRRSTSRRATASSARRCCRSSIRSLAEKYGLADDGFVVENVSVPPEVEQAIDKRSSMAAVGNLNDYVKFQMAQGLEKGGGGAGGMAAEMAVGMAMAQQMMNQTGGIDGPVDAGHRGAAPRRRRRAAMPELMTPAQVAQALGVAESDVMASLEAGDLKGKRIGTQWRVTRAAVDAFLQFMMRDMTRRAAHSRRCASLAPRSRFARGARRRRIRARRDGAEGGARLARASSTSSTPQASYEAAGAKFRARDHARRAGRDALEERARAARAQCSAACASSRRSSTSVAGRAASATTRSSRSAPRSPNKTDAPETRARSSASRRRVARDRLRRFSEHPSTPADAPAAGRRTARRSPKFACPACGGEAVWNPAKQKLVCPFCGTESPAPPDARARSSSTTSSRALRGHRRRRARLAAAEAPGQLPELPARSRCSIPRGRRRTASSAARRSSCPTTRRSRPSARRACCRSA